MVKLFYARLKIIDHINKIPESAEIPAVEVYHKSRQMNKIRIIHFSFQSLGCCDTSPGQKDVMKLICQLGDVMGLELRSEPDYQLAMHIPDAVIAGIEMMNLLHRFIHRTYPFKERKVRRVDIVASQQLFLEELYYVGPI